MVPVQTALPAFVGYTAKAARGSKSLINKPTKVTSFGQFVELFGGAPDTKFIIEANEASAQGFQLSFLDASRYMLFNSIRLFYANGGADCYIVSVGLYGEEINGDQLTSKNNGGIAALEKSLEPTLLVVPDAVLLSADDCFAVQAQMLSHCGYKMKNRFAILDVYDGDKERTFDEDDIVDKFREGVGSNFLMWGAAYYPYIQTNIVKSADLDFTRIDNKEVLIEVLNTEVDKNLANGVITEARAEGIKKKLPR